MKKMIILTLALVVFAGMAMAQTGPTYVTGASGITGIDKLGAHQNGGRGCVGCHAPHSGVRGNGGAMQWDGSKYVSVATVGDSGDEVLWGQDLGPIYGIGTITFAGGAAVDLTDVTKVPERVKTGVVMCLSCHDGNVAKGAMMTGNAFEQQFLASAGYGTQKIPTLLGNDGGTTGNYANDHPVGPAASVNALGTSLKTSFKSVLDATSGKYKIVTDQTVQPAFATFATNYGLPLLDGARAGAGWAVDETTPTDATLAYVVCTTCHTPHTMYVTSASSTNPIAGKTTGNFPTYFFLAAPYNPAPAAFPTDGSKASSATQFCRQCHFKGAGGSNEASGISVPTAF